MAHDADAVVRQHADLEPADPGLLHEGIGVRIAEAIGQVHGEVPEQEHNRRSR